jgi:CheY-like chemotaxis protein
VSPSAVLLDLHLPMADGVEFLRQLRAIGPAGRVPTAIVTGDYFIEKSVTAEIHTLGARLCYKPLWEDDLLNLLRDLLEGGHDALS